jgi:uncharacterized protein involved in tolerance to divalent cations
LKPNSTYVLAEEENPVEGYVKIKIKTEYGYLKGYIESQSLEALNPYSVPELVLAEPVEYKASSSKEQYFYYGLKKVSDGIEETTWCEDREGNGINEWLSLKFNASGQPSVLKNIKTIGIYTGQGTEKNAFDASTRPVGFNIHFMKSGAINEKVYVNIMDACGMQYISLNKPVQADEVRFIIKTVSDPAQKNDAKIAEIELYE